MDVMVLLLVCVFACLSNPLKLKIERDAGGVFKGWNEGKIYFAPTYKYSYISDSYIGEVVQSNTKRTSAWCDRILWHGDGIVQLSYLRGESRFSDHRPVCAIFKVEVGVLNDGTRKGFSTPSMRIGVEELLPANNNCTTVKESEQHHQRNTSSSSSSSRAKIVLKLSMVDPRQRAKAMSCAARFLGVISVSYKGDKMTVVGEGIDSVELRMLLRSKMGYVELLKVKIIGEKKETNIKNTLPSPYYHVQHVDFVTQLIKYYVVIEVFNYEQTNCSIM